MTTTLHLPEDLADAVRQRAAQGGHDLAEEVVELLRKGLAVSQNTAPAPQRHQALNIQTDPVTGLPVIISPPDAPIHSMTVDQIIALEWADLEEEELERAGLPLRH
jgi:plasmid stability protein